MTADEAERKAIELFTEHDREVAEHGEAYVGFSRINAAGAYATLALSLRLKEQSK